jgi:hypothetical protein
MIRIGRTQGRSGRCFECRGSVEMEWTPPSLRGRRAQQMCGGPPEPIGINVPEWRFDTST